MRTIFVQQLGKTYICEAFLALTFLGLGRFAMRSKYNERLNLNC